MSAAALTTLAAIIGAIPTLVAWAVVAACAYLGVLAALAHHAPTHRPEAGRLDEWDGVR